MVHDTRNKHFNQKLDYRVLQINPIIYQKYANSGYLVIVITLRKA